MKGLGWLGVFAAVSDQTRPETRPPQIPRPDSAWGSENIVYSPRSPTLSGAIPYRRLSSVMCVASDWNTCRPRAIRRPSTIDLVRTGTPVCRPALCRLGNRSQRIRTDVTCHWHRSMVGAIARRQGTAFSTHPLGRELRSCCYKRSPPMKLSCRSGFVEMRRTTSRQSETFKGKGRAM